MALTQILVYQQPAGEERRTGVSEQSQNLPQKHSGETAAASPVSGQLHIRTANVSASFPEILARITVMFNSKRPKVMENR